jgi:hypothetical protein
LVDVEVGVLLLVIEASVPLAAPEPSELESVGLPASEELVAVPVLDGVAELDVVFPELMALFWN